MSPFWHLLDYDQALPRKVAAILPTGQSAINYVFDRTFLEDLLTICCIRLDRRRPSLDDPNITSIAFLHVMWVCAGPFKTRHNFLKQIALLRVCSFGVIYAFLTLF